MTLRLPVTDGTELRSLTERDAATLLDVIDRHRDAFDPWLRWSSGVTTEEAATRLIREAALREREGTGFHLGLWRDGSELIGGVPCWWNDRTHRVAEVGYWLVPAVRGRGLAQRSLRRVVDFLFEHWEVNRVELQCRVDNAASRRVAEEAGGALEGTRRQSHLVDGAFRDHAVYSILAAEWSREAPEPEPPIRVGALRPLSRVVTAPLFPGLHRHLVELLRGLAPPDWERPTVAGAWAVRDVVAHLVDVQARRLSARRDGHVPPPDRELYGYADLVAYLDGLNASWVVAARRLSPGLLVDFLETVGPPFARLMSELDPDGRAPFPVAWAGEEESKNWFDIGRDYTELWHHQAQVRAAVGVPLLNGRGWLGPVLSLAVRALPRTLRDALPSEGRGVVLHVRGEAGGAWSAVAEDGWWVVYEGDAAAATARVTLDDDLAWRLFFNALAEEDAHGRVEVTGDRELTDAVLRMRSVMV